MNSVVHFDVLFLHHFIPFNQLFNFVFCVFEDSALLGVFTGGAGFSFFVLILGVGRAEFLFFAVLAVVVVDVDNFPFRLFVYELIHVGLVFLVGFE